MTVINENQTGGSNGVQDVPHEAKTMVLDTTEEKILGPRLVCTSASGESQIFPLDKSQIVIGRSQESDLPLLDPLISRKHCLIQIQDNGYWVRNVSTTNPLFQNDQPITENRLYNGDQIRVGNTTLAFISDRAHDVKKHETKVVSHKKGAGWGFWFTVCLLLLLGGYLSYLRIYMPWKVGQELTSISDQVIAGQFLPAQDRLKQLLTKNLSGEDNHKALELLAQTAMAITEQKEDEKDLEGAVDYLKSYLTAYGAGKEAENLWDRLDYYRLVIGQRHELSKDFQLALSQYAAIRDDSLYFEEAQKAIRRIWLAYQQPAEQEQPKEQSSPKPQEQTIAELLKEAEKHFAAQRYLIPVNQNAYAVYQAILGIDPVHKQALKRIEEMKFFYRRYGEHYFEKEKWDKALTYFKRYWLIEPESADVQEKIILCRENITEQKKRKKESQDNATASRKTLKDRLSAKQSQAENQKREEIKRLLEESGNNSSWIMQYLFEEEKDEKETVTPW